MKIATPLLQVGDKDIDALESINVVRSFDRHSSNYSFVSRDWD